MFDLVIVRQETGKVLFRAADVKLDEVLKAVAYGLQRLANNDEAELEIGLRRHVPQP